MSVVDGAAHTQKDDVESNRCSLENVAEIFVLFDISYSVANCGLDKFFLLTLQSHPVLVEGTET